MNNINKILFCKEVKALIFNLIKQTIKILMNKKAVRLALIIIKKNRGQTIMNLLIRYIQIQ